MISIGALIGLVLGGVAITLSPPPFRRAFEHGLNRAMSNELLPLDSALNLKQREKIDDGLFKLELRKYGFDETRANLMIQGIKKLLSITELVSLRQRENISDKEYKDELRKQGLDNWRAERLLTLPKKFLEPDIVIRAMWRKIKFGKDLGTYKDELRKQGYTPDRIKVIEEVMKFYPSPADLIVWQAKEVYEPDAIKKFGLADELELLEKEPMYKAGLNDEQIKNYWIAHWVHPAWSQIAEMLHRTDLTEEDVYEWFRLVEIPPFWREKFTKIMYSPYTRVDVRRMNKLGILDRAAVKQSYIELGYDEEKAENMTEFTIRYNEEEPEEDKTAEEKRRDELRGMTRSVILKRYKDSMITLSECQTYLKDIGLTPEVTDFYISMADYEREEEMVDGLIKAYHRMYINGVMDYNKTIDLLGELNIPAKHTDYLLAIWDMEKLTKPSQPSKSELIKLAKGNIIDKGRFKLELGNLGYKTEYVDWYIKLNELFVEV